MKFLIYILFALAVITLAVWTLTSDIFNKEDE